MLEGFPFSPCIGDSLILHSSIKGSRKKVFFSGRTPNVGSGFLLQVGKSTWICNPGLK